MSKIALYAAAALVVISLSGCAAGVDAAAPAKIAAASGASAPNAAPADSSGPVLTPEVEANPAAAEYDTAIRRIPGLENVDAEAALAVGEEVCGQLDAGTDPLTITAVEDTDRANNWDAITVATLTLCTEHVDPVQAVFNAVLYEENVG